MNQQLTIFDVLGVDIEPKKSSISTSDIEPKSQALYRFLGQAAKKVECSVNEYESSKCPKRFYFRVSWRQGKMKHLHIPGGSTLSQLAQYRAAKLREMIERGAELGEIIAAVETYRGKRK